MNPPSEQADTSKKNLEQNFRSYFEANLLDGDDVYDCGGAMLRADNVYETLLPFLAALTDNKERT